MSSSYAKRPNRKRNNEIRINKNDLNLMLNDVAFEQTG